MSTSSDNTKSESSGNDDKHPNKGNDDGKDAKPYYALSIGGKAMTVHYVHNKQEWLEPKSNIALAWVEEKDTLTHYFLFYLADGARVLSAKYSPRNGLSTTLIKIIDHKIDNENYQNARRWKRGVRRDPKNYSDNEHVYKNKIKVQTADGFTVKVKVELAIRKYRDDQLVNIENPIVVQDIGDVQDEETADE